MMSAPVSGAAGVTLDLIGRPIHFYDSAEPANVPSGVYAAAYVNGRFAWPEHHIKRMSHVFRITVLPGAGWAHRARCIDIERGDATPEDAMPFLIERNRHYGDATAYCDRSTFPEVRNLCERAGILNRVRFWIATLDGTQDVPGAWAVQYQGGIRAGFDVSVLHGINDIHRS